MQRYSPLAGQLQSRLGVKSTTRPGKRGVMLGENALHHMPGLIGYSYLFLSRLECRFRAVLEDND